jgi:hypothetical protein
MVRRHLSDNATALAGAPERGAMSASVKGFAQ